MNFSLTFEERALKDSVARFVANFHGFEEVRRLAKISGNASEHWRKFADLGWLALLVSEQNGGLGGSWIEGALVMEEFGRGLVSAPYVSTALLAAKLLDTDEPTVGTQVLIDRLTSGNALISVAVEMPSTNHDLALSVNGMHATRCVNGFRLSGRALLCLDGGIATDFIIPAWIDDVADWGLFHIPSDADGLTRLPYRTIDARTAADITLANVNLGVGSMVLGPQHMVARFEEALDGARLMLAAEAIGIMEAAIKSTIDYLGSRKQFGHPLSSYQVLRHRVADMLVRKEHARSILYRGLSSMGSPSNVRASAVSATMAAIIERGEFIGSQAIQLHGGMGMAEEYVIGHYYKRLRSIGKTWGDLGWHLNRFIENTVISEDKVAA